jgi:hypothetical protein
MASSKHACFYSTKCPWSKAFLSELANTPFKNEFKLVCVDPPLSTTLPKWLKKVPTIVIQGETEPRVDGDVMNWLYEEKMKQGEVSNNNNVSNEVESWNSAEHSSFSKGAIYSFNNIDASVQGNGGSAIPGAFSFLNGNSGMGDKSANDFNPGRSEQGRNKSKKEEMFDKQMEEYQRSREVGMPQYKRAT